MNKLTVTQQIIFDKLDGIGRSAYELKTSLATLRALVRKGYANDVTQKGPGSMFSPQTHFKFTKRNNS